MRRYWQNKQDSGKSRREKGARRARGGFAIEIGGVVVCLILCKVADKVLELYSRTISRHVVGGTAVQWTFMYFLVG